MAIVPAVAQKVNPTDPQPTCHMCPGTYIPVSELEAYTKKAIAEHLVVAGSLLAQVNDLEVTVSTLSDDALKDLTVQFRACLAGEHQPRRAKIFKCLVSLAHRPVEGRGGAGMGRV